MKVLSTRFSTQNRSIKTLFVAESETGEGTFDAIEVSTTHFGSSKCYASTAYAVTVGHDRGFTTTSYSPMDGVRLHVEAGVARYNARKMEGVHALVVEAVEVGATAMSRLDPEHPVAERLAVLSGAVVES